MIYRAMPLQLALALASALALCGCGSVELRQTHSQTIEVIDSNYVDSSNDTEIVFTETPWQSYAAVDRSVNEKS